jgi:hypothetical protein
MYIKQETGSGTRFPHEDLYCTALVTSPGSVCALLQRLKFTNHDVLKVHKIHVEHTI